MFMKSINALCLFAIGSVALADDLDLLVDARTPPEERGNVYARLATVDFPSIAPKLATLIGTHPVLTGIGPRTKQPWLEEQMSEGDRIGCTLNQLWSFHVDRTRLDGQQIGLLLTILEDPSVGQGRYLPLQEIASRLHYGKYDATYTNLPPVKTVLDRLDRLVRDESTPNHFRQNILAILFEHGDPNQYLDLTITISSSSSTDLQRSEAFRFCTPTLRREHLSAANQALYLRHAFTMLEKINDGKSGTGYFLAMHIGAFIGIKPVRAGQGAFAPDQRRRRYQKQGGLNERFFQETVDNALQWWKNNRHAYNGNK